MGEELARLLRSSRGHEDTRRHAVSRKGPGHRSGRQLAESVLALDDEGDLGRLQKRANHRQQLELDRGQDQDRTGGGIVVFGHSARLSQRSQTAVLTLNGWQGAGVQSLAMSLPKILLPIVALIALLVGWNWWTSDARRIASRLSGLTEEVEKRPGEGQLAMALKSEQVASYFAEPFRFRALQFDFETDHRGTLVRSVAAYRLRSDRIAASVLHRELEIDAANRTAKMVLLVRFAGGFGGSANEAYRFQLNWIEQQGLWKIDYADLIEIVPASL